MKEIERIIKDAGHENDSFFHIKISNGSYMDLTIEGIGLSPDGRKMVSVAHYYEQRSDLMRDPEMTFLLATGCNGFADGWYPVSIQMDGIGYYRVAIKWEGSQMVSNRREMRDEKSFARTWNSNIRHQGFAKAHKAQMAAA
jgi:hypothetical protein